MYRVIVTVKEVKGHCGIHKVGYRSVVDEGQILSLDTEIASASMRWLV